MDRRTFVARSLPAMLLALLGLRLPNALSLSARCRPEVDPQPFLDHMEAHYPRWSARIQPNSRAGRW